MFLPALSSSIDTNISGSANWNCWSSFWPRGKPTWWSWETERTQVLDDVIEFLITPPAVWTPPTSRFSVLWNTKFPHDLRMLDSGCPSLAARGILCDPHHGVGLLFGALGRTALSAPYGWVGLCHLSHVSWSPLELSLFPLHGNWQHSRQRLFHLPGSLSNKAQIPSHPPSPPPTGNPQWIT